MINKFSFSDWKFVKTPISTYLNISTDSDGPDVNPIQYNVIIGSLLYLTASRHDILFSISMCACFQTKPKESHLLTVEHIFRYLKCTPNLGHWYPCDYDFNLTRFTDFDYVGYSLDWKSTYGGCQILGNRFISWSSKNHSLVACLTVEVEYVATGRCCDHIL